MERSSFMLETSIRHEKKDLNDEVCEEDMNLNLWYCLTDAIQNKAKQSFPTVIPTLYHIFHLMLLKYGIFKTTIKHKYQWNVSRAIGFLQKATLKKFLSNLSGFYPVTWRKMVLKLKSRAKEHHIEF